MRCICCFAVLLLTLLVSVPAQAQVLAGNTVGGETSAKTATDTISQQKSFFLEKWGKPEKAALYSAVLPGLGQAYNKSYWKIPILYAGLGVIGYFIKDYNTYYQDFSLALSQRSSLKNIDEAYDKFRDSRIYGIRNPDGSPNTNAIASLKRSKDLSHRYRDMNILFAIGIYGLNIAEAHVHAHLKDFNVSDNLAFQVQPGLISLPEARVLTPGLTLSFYSRTR